MLKIDNKRVGSWRWVVALLLFAIATVNYIDGGKIYDRH